MKYICPFFSNLKEGYFLYSRTLTNILYVLRLFIMRAENINILKIQNHTPEDWVAIARVHAAVVRGGWDVDEALVSAAAVTFRSLWESYCGRGVSMAAYYNQEMVGFSLANRAYDVNGRWYAEIDYLYVMPGFQRAAFGGGLVERPRVGGRLLYATEQELLLDGRIEFLRLYFNDTDKKLINFYRKQGYETAWGEAKKTRIKFENQKSTLFSKECR